MSGATNTETGQSVAPRYLRMAPGTRSHSRFWRVAMLATQPLSFGTKLPGACVRGSRPIGSAQGRLFTECAGDGAPAEFSQSAKLGTGLPRRCWTSAAEGGLISVGFFGTASAVPFPVRSSAKAGSTSRACRRAEANLVDSTFSFPALPCRAFTCRRFAAGNGSVPSLELVGPAELVMADA
jgi:hypothetical protein